MLAWTSLGLAATAEVLRSGLTSGRAALLGAFVACAGATKDQYAANFVFVAPLLLGLHFASGASHRWRGFGGRFVGPAIAAASLLAVFVLASGIPLDPKGFLQRTALMFSVGPGAGVKLLGWHSLRTFDLMHAMRNDSRYAASAWLDAHTQPGDSVLFFGAPARAGVRARGPRKRAPALTAGETAPHNPPAWRVNEPMRE